MKTQISMKSPSYRILGSTKSNINLGETMLPPISKKYIPGSNRSHKSLCSYPYSEKALSHLNKDDIKFKIIAQKKKMANMSHLFKIDVDSFYSFRNYLQTLTEESPEFKELKVYLK